MIRSIATIILVLTCGSLAAQTNEEKLIGRMKEFHGALNDFIVVGSYVHEKASYGHSSGWIQKKEDLIKDAGVKTIYYSFKEDSINVVIDKGIAHIRFIADIDVQLNEVRGHYHLKVLEVWIKKRGGWSLFARQAMK